MEYCGRVELLSNCSMAKSPFNCCPYRVAAASLLLRLYCYFGIGWNHDPWSYRFFPFELLLFVTGMLSYRAYRFVRRMQLKKKSLLQYASSRFRIGGVAIIVLLFFWSSTLLSVVLVDLLGVPIGRLVSYLPWFFFVPTAFHWTKRLSLDRLLGELSYPIYLGHYFLVGLLAAVYTRLPNLPDNAKGRLSLSFPF